MRSFLTKKIIAYCLAMCLTLTLFGVFPASATDTDYSAAYEQLQANAQEVTVTLSAGSGNPSWQSEEFDTTKPWAVVLEHTYSGTSRSWYMFGNRSRFYIGIGNNALQVGQYGTDAFRDIAHPHTPDTTYTYAFVVVPQSDETNNIVIFEKTAGGTYSKLAETVMQVMSNDANNFKTNGTSPWDGADTQIKYYKTGVSPYGQEKTVTLTAGSGNPSWQSEEFDTTKPWAVVMTHSYSGSKSFYVHGNEARLYVGLGNSKLQVGQYGTDAFRDISRTHTTGETYTYIFAVDPQTDGTNKVKICVKNADGSYTKLDETVLQTVAATNDFKTFGTSAWDGEDTTVKYYGSDVTTDPGTDPDGPGTDPDGPGTDPDEPGTDPASPIVGEELTVTQKLITIGSTTQTGWESQVFDETKPWTVVIEHTYSGSKNWYVWGKLSRLYVGLGNSKLQVGQYGTDAFRDISHPHTNGSTYTYALVVDPQESGTNNVTVFAKNADGTYTQLGETVFQNMAENANNTAHNFITTQDRSDGSTITDTTFKYYGTAVAIDPGTDPDGPGTDPDGPGTDPDGPGTDPDGPGTDPDEPGTDPGDDPDPVDPALFAEAEELPVTRTDGSEEATPIWQTVDFYETEPWAFTVEHTYQGTGRSWYVFGKAARLYVGITSNRLQVGKYDTDAFKDITRTHNSGVTYTYAFAILPQGDGTNNVVIYAKEGSSYTELGRTIMDTAGSADNLKAKGTNKWAGTDTNVKYYAQRVRWNITVESGATSLNQVNVTGKAEKYNEPLTAKLYQNGTLVEGKTKTVTTDANGDFAFGFMLDPDNDAGGEGYHIEIEGEIAKTARYPETGTFSLVGSTVMGAAKTAFNTAASDAEVLTALTNNASSLGLETAFADIINPSADPLDKEIAENAFLTAYNQMKDAAMFDSNAAFAENMVAISTKGARIIDAVNAYNAAVQSESWGQIQDVMTKTYPDIFTGLASTAGKAEDGVYLGLIPEEGTPFTPLTSVGDIKNAFANAVNAAPDAPAGSTGTPGTSTPPSFGGGGGGGGGGGSTTVASPSTTPAGSTPESGSTDAGGSANKPQELLPAAPFSDTKDAEWARTYIDFMRSNGYIHGDGKGNFKPNDMVSREEFIKMLVTAFGIELKAADKNAFTDVTADDWCRDYVFSAKSAGIINGYNDGSFGKGQKITRGDVAVMLHRICESGEYDITPVNPSVVFDDYYLMEEYTRGAINDFVQAGILSGYSDGTFGSQNGATRAESCAMIYRLLMKKR